MVVRSKRTARQKCRTHTHIHINVRQNQWTNDYVYENGDAGDNNNKKKKNE